MSNWNQLLTITGWTRSAGSSTPPGPVETSWTNTLSSGDRTSYITTTVGGAFFTVSPVGRINDGSYLANGTNSWYFNNTSVAGNFIKFTFSSPKRIDGFILVATNATDISGSWTFQGSADNSTWVDLQSFDWNAVATRVPYANGATEPLTGQVLNTGGFGMFVSTFTFTNTNSYTYYRFLGVSGTGISSPYQQEVMFKISSGT